MSKEFIKLFKNIFGAAIGLISVCAVSFLTILTASAATNITSTPAYHWGWNDVVGWMDFYQLGNSSTTIASVATTTGWASSSAGYISLDCGGAPPPPGNSICGTSNYGVYNPGNGKFTGWAWNDTYGWISFWCGDPGVCGVSDYGVQVGVTASTTSGSDFTGYAWNDVIGWISFNCNQWQWQYETHTCDTSDYKVNTDWTSTSTSGYLDSSTYDTGVSGGAQLNSIVWQGPPLPAETAVRFQIATSNSSNPASWDFIGPDGTGNSYYAGLGTPGSPIQLDYVLHNNQRYFRYRVILVSDAAQRNTPTVNDIIINWSP